MKDNDDQSNTDSNAKAGSEEEMRETILTYLKKAYFNARTDVVGEQNGFLKDSSHALSVLENMTDSLMQNISIAIAQSSAQAEKNRYCGICYKPSISQGGWYCEEHGYKSVYITQLEAQELRNSGIAQAEIRGRIDELKWALEAAGGQNIAMKERLANLIKGQPTKNTNLREAEHHH